ncbi:thioredoxin family protein [Chitinophaga agrisoli]|uniref:Thioredoxin family protein n=1 Tax=Chitinophaga agrisoli TaxID=2607653 RepID=A0A5B2W563_9BACT|nr:thioredoxin family protein [Chitinophaga agrisoli]KAA2245782.1 thioredoxin family protein [Chitinophaga agrisoli]
MKSILICCILLFSASLANAQAPYDLEHIYDPGANAAADLEKAVQQAAREHKHVLLQIGGNWCIWCRRLYKVVHDDAALTKQIDQNYVVCHLNYSKENKNLPLLQQLGYPQRFGFPVLVILDAKGNRLHTQNTALLEDADGYDKEKLQDLFKQWSPAALNPALYTNQ